MFLEPIERTDAGNEYQSYFLVPRRISRGTHSRRVVNAELLLPNRWGDEYEIQYC